MKKPAKKQKILFMSLIAAVVVLVISIPAIIYFAEKNASEKTYPLGSQLEYVGKESYGCWLICDSNPSSIYYYATDMNINDVIKYFQKATVVKNPSDVNGQIYFGIKTPSGETIYTNYYTDKNDVYKNNSHLKPTEKSHILEIPNFKYEAVKQSL